MQHFFLAATPEFEYRTQHTEGCMMDDVDDLSYVQGYDWGYRAGYRAGSSESAAVAEQDDYERGKVTAEIVQLLLAQGHVEAATCIKVYRQ